MTPIRTHVTIVTVLLAAVLLAPSRPAAAAKVAVDQRLPADVYAYVSIPDVPAAKARFKASSLGQITRDPAFAEIVKQIEVQIKKGSAELEKQIGIKLNDLLEIPSGEISIAVGKSDRPVPAIAVFLDFGKKEETVDKIIAVVTKELKKGNINRRTDTYKGTKIISYFEKVADDAEGEETAPKMDHAYFIKDSFVVFGTDVAFLKKVVDRWDGKHEKTFAKTAAYKYIKARTKTGRAPVASWYLDPIGLLNAAILNNPEIGPEAGLALGFLKPLGLANFKAVGGSMDWNVGEYDSLTKMVMYVEKPVAGALGLFKFPPTEQQAPKWIPGSATNYIALNWDMPAAYKAAAEIYGTISLGGPKALAEKLEELAKDPAGPKIHAKKDVLDHLDGRMHVFTDFKNPDEPSSMRVFFAIGAKDAKKIEAVLKKVAGLPDFPGATRKFKGHTIYTIDGDDFGAVGASVAFTVARKHLVVASDPVLIEQAILGDPKRALANDATYKAIVGKLPKKTSMLMFQRGNSQLKAIYEQLRSGNVPLGEGAPDIDFSKLPPFSAMMKYLTPSGGYAVPDKHGVYMESFSLRPKKDKK